MSLDNEFEKDLRIDIEHLEVEACILPELMFKWAKEARLAREEMDKVKFNLEMTEAKLTKKARLNPEGFGLSRVTENALSAAVKLHPNYQEAFEEVIAARSEADLMVKAVDAIEAKKRMIEMLVQLYGKEYFAGPSVPHSAAELWKETEKRRHNEVHEEMVAGTKKKVIRTKNRARIKKG